MSNIYSDFIEQKNYGDNAFTRKVELREQKAENDHDRILSLIEEAKETRESALSSYEDFKERTLHEFTSTALKAIYMTALSETMMFTGNTKLIAESLIDKYINEHEDGVYGLLNKMQGKTYLLNTIYEAVEDEAEKSNEDVEAENQETHDITDEGGKKENILNKMEDEEDVEAAVNIIAQRITSAEEEFIRKNAEDKQKIEDLMKGMNERLQSAKRDPNVSEEEEQEIEQESKIEIKNGIENIHNERPHTVFESFVEKLSTSVVSDDSKGMKELYFSENGKIDIQSIVEASKCLYGFLEFVNTVQLEKVDSEYIKKVLAEL